MCHINFLSSENLQFLEYTQPQGFDIMDCGPVLRSFNTNDFILPETVLYKRAFGGGFFFFLSPVHLSFD